MKTIHWIIAMIIAAIAGCRAAAAQERMPHEGAHAATGHAIVAAESLKWSPARPGISVAVVAGSPEVEGAPFVIRFKIAEGTRVPPHWHPVDEHLTVVTGTFFMGVGEQFSEAGGVALTAGTYALMPKEVRHFGWTGGETIVQIHGVGPFKTYFVERPLR